MKVDLSEGEFRILLDWWMMSDPSPLEEADDRHLNEWLHCVAGEFGYPTVTEAYHYHLKDTRE